MLESLLPDTQEIAAKALRNLAADPDNGLPMRAAGTVAALLRLLHASPPRVQEQAAGALGNLAALEAIDALASLLRTGVLQVQEEAAASLRNMSCDAVNSPALSLAIEPLVWVLSAGSDITKEEAAITLANLAAVGMPGPHLRARHP
jgi:HEAT repeat protein